MKKMIWFCTLTISVFSVVSTHAQEYEPWHTTRQDPICTEEVKKELGITGDMDTPDELARFVRSEYFRKALETDPMLIDDLKMFFDQMGRTGDPVELFREYILENMPQITGRKPGTPEAKYQRLIFGDPTNVQVLEKKDQIQWVGQNPGDLLVVFPVQLLATVVDLMASCCNVGINTYYTQVQRDEECLPEWHPTYGKPRVEVEAHDGVKVRVQITPVTEVRYTMDTKTVCDSREYEEREIVGVVDDRPKMPEKVVYEHQGIPEVQEQKHSGTIKHEHSGKVEVEHSGTVKLEVDGGLELEHVGEVVTRYQPLAGQQELTGPVCPHIDVDFRASGFSRFGGIFKPSNFAELGLTLATGVGASAAFSDEGARKDAALESLGYSAGAFYLANAFNPEKDRVRFYFGNQSFTLKKGDSVTFEGGRAEWRDGQVDIFALENGVERKCVEAPEPKEINYTPVIQAKSFDPCPFTVDGERKDCFLSLGGEDLTFLDKERGIVIENGGTVREGDVGMDSGFANISDRVD